ncbi:hypothetical protein GH733_018272, partial [Mirounga leonina]
MLLTLTPLPRLSQSTSAEAWRQLSTPHTHSQGLSSSGRHRPRPPPAGHTANFRLGPWFFPSPKPQMSTAAPEHTWAPPFPPLMLNPRPKPGLSLPRFKPLVHSRAVLCVENKGCAPRAPCPSAVLCLWQPAAGGRGSRERPLTPLPGARPSSSSFTTSSPRPLPATPRHQDAKSLFTQERAARGDSRVNAQLLVAQGAGAGGGPGEGGSQEAPGLLSLWGRGELRLAGWGARWLSAPGHGGLHVTTWDRSGHRRSSETPDPKLPASEQSARDRRCYGEGHHLTVEALLFNLTKTEDRGLDTEAEGGLCTCAQRPHLPGPRHDGQATLGCRSTQEPLTKDGLHC